MPVLLSVSSPVSNSGRRAFDLNASVVIVRLRHLHARFGVSFKVIKTVNLGAVKRIISSQSAWQILGLVSFIKLPVC